METKVTLVLRHPTATAEEMKGFLDSILSSGMAVDGNGGEVEEFQVAYETSDKEYIVIINYDDGRRECHKFLATDEDSAYLQWENSTGKSDDGRYVCVIPAKNLREVL